MPPARPSDDPAPDRVPDRAQDPACGAADPGLCLGLDCGTSGVRAVAVDARGGVAAAVRRPWAPPERSGGRVRQDPMLWWSGVCQALEALLPQIDRERVRALAVAGTSGSWLLTDAHGEPLGPASMYDDSSAAELAAALGALAPPDTAALGPASPLARLIRARAGAPPAVAHLQHQAEWIAGRLADRPGLGDEHNALKLGYDPQARLWPAWLEAAGAPRAWLPRVLPSGRAIGPLAPALARRFALPATLQVMAGTTDGVAGYLAAGAEAPGDGVTSLGSTLVLKQWAPQRVTAPALGVYSHRLGDDGWLVGGASNSGGAALARHFGPEAIAALTPHLQPERPTGLDYRPLAGVGERFPVADASLRDRSAPRPADDARHLQGLLEGIAGVEAEGYRVLAALGAPPLVRVLSVGGGARNPAWTRIRERRLGVPVHAAAQDEPAVGAARLAWRGLAAALGPR